MNPIPPYSDSRSPIPGKGTAALQRTKPGSVTADFSPGQPPVKSPSAWLEQLQQLPSIREAAVKRGQDLVAQGNYPEQQILTDLAGHLIRAYERGTTE